MTHPVDAAERWDMTVALCRFRRGAWARVMADAATWIDGSFHLVFFFSIYIYMMWLLPTGLFTSNHP